MQRHGVHDVAFSAYNADTEDYYAYLPSDESMSEDENESASNLATSNCDVVDDVTSAFASIGSRVFTPIGSLNGFTLSVKPTKRMQEKPVKVPVFGVFIRGHGDQLNVSSQALKLYHARRLQLQDALDTATGDNTKGEAPFRFTLEQTQVVRGRDTIGIEEFNASPAPVIDRVEGHAPEKKDFGKKQSITDREERMAQEEMDERSEQDPLYDEQLDEVDEQWVQMNLRGVHAAKLEIDVMLCCPCCFVTVCMACERHTTYTNQYRATTAINCRVKRGEILTYDASSASNRVPASLPFQKRQNVSTDNDHKTTCTTTPDQQIANLLQEDEFYSVTCSDCGTMVGVFDRNQQYHFFNTLPSNC
ncbi:unnamed protein product [Peronospora belbahrii]|uniref:E2F-associated phosphoprotein n=1 Tax=Peronospora belbahrii TaxID=622444 RepID=A0AAU9L3B9_9STRA|nr:unnamed protein product [Peronospora belbahrii]CAH0521131.1 unnamed protein product [Peronospora belbahrii]